MAVLIFKYFEYKKIALKGNKQGGEWLLPPPPPLL